MSIQDILASIAVVLNGLPQALLALNYGFAAFPTALGFVIGIFGMLLTGQVTPISYQTEAIVLAGEMGKDRNERLNIVFFTGIVMAIIGILGLLEPTIAFIGEDILNGMMAGVGITLAKSGIDMFKTNSRVSVISFLSAILVYFATEDLVYTIVVSVILGTLVDIAYKKIKNIQFDEVDEEAMKNERLQPLKITPNGNVIKSTLALVTMQIGGNIAYANITAGMANAPVNVDYVTAYSGIADSVSAFFGGSPVEAIISGTAAAPNPVFSGVLMMAIFVALLLSKQLPKIARFVPSESICGFLFVLGAVSVFPSNMAAGIGINPITSGVTAIVTAITDPFIGMIIGLVVKFLLSIFA